MVTPRKTVEMTIGITEALGRRTWTVGGDLLGEKTMGLVLLQFRERPTEVIQAASTSTGLCICLYRTMSSAYMISLELRERGIIGQRIQIDRKE